MVLMDKAYSFKYVITPKHVATTHHFCILD